MYLVINRKNLRAFRAYSAAEADDIAKSDALTAEQIAWSIEEYGRCDGNDYTIIPEEWENPDDKA